MSERRGISVVIPVYNGADFVADAVTSVRAQSLPATEILVVDDGSSDATVSVVRGLGPGVELHRLPENRGPSAARNLGIERSRGDILAFLDADDLWPVDRLRVLMLQLERQPELEIVLGRARLTGELTAQDLARQFDAVDRTMTIVSFGAGVFRRSVFDRVGRLDEGLRQYEDYDWFLHARELDVRMVIVDDVTLEYRRRRDSLSQQTNSRVGLMQVLRNSLARRRDQHGQAPELRKFLDHRSSPSPKSASEQAVEREVGPECD